MGISSNSYIQIDFSEILKSMDIMRENFQPVTRQASAASTVTLGKVAEGLGTMKSVNQICESILSLCRSTDDLYEEICAELRKIAKDIEDVEDDSGMRDI